MFIYFSLKKNSFQKGVFLFSIADYTKKFQSNTGGVVCRFGTFLNTHHLIDFISCFKSSLSKYQLIVSIKSLLDRLSRAQSGISSFMILL